MEPTSRQIIESWPETTEESAKLIFIRQSATEAYANGQIEAATKEFVKEIVPILVVASMSKEQIGIHIANLERARAFLAAFTQGLVIGHETEMLPIFKEKARKRAEEKRQEKLVGKQTTKVNDLISLARDLASKGLETSNQVAIKTIATKVECPTCKKLVYSLKFHKC
jgi:hypothetical protein